MENTVYENIIDTKRVRKYKRKYHAIQCNCVFCQTQKYPEPLPNWACFCPECTDITPEEMQYELATSDFVQYPRRANNIECRCGLCAACVPDTEYFYTVYHHELTRVGCECPFCQTYEK